MSKYQKFKNAIEAFQSDGADTPIIYSITELNEKGFKELIGRRIKSQRSILVVTVVYVICILAVTIIALAKSGTMGSTVFTLTLYIPHFITLYFYRTTLITFTADGLDFYFTDSVFGSKYIVYDKSSLLYDSITNVNVRTGKFNTKVTFEFSKDDKKYKINTTVPNKMKKMEEQAENTKHMLEVLKAKHLISD